MKRIEASKDELKRSMGFLNFDDRTITLTMGVPVALTAYGAFHTPTDPFSLTCLSASLAISAVAAYCNYRQVKKQRSPSASASYLLDLDTRLRGKEKLVKRYDRIFEEFIND